MAPVVWYLVVDKNNEVRREYRVWNEFTKLKILLYLRQQGCATILLSEEWKAAAILRVDEDESWTIPF